MHDTRWMTDAALAGTAAAAALVWEHHTLRPHLSDADRYTLGVSTLLVAYGAWCVRHDQSGRGLLALLIVVLCGGAATRAAFVADDAQAQAATKAGLAHLYSNVLATFKEQAAWAARN